MYFDIINKFNHIFKPDYYIFMGYSDYCILLGRVNYN